MFGLGKRQKILSSHVSLSVYQIFQNFESLYNILHIFTQVIQTLCLVTRFCVEAISRVPVSNTFPTHKTIRIEIILVLDVPECVEHIRLTESFHQIYALASLARIFQL